MDLTKVFARLKPKTASLGFNKAELQGIAANIADNLNSEDAADEEIDAAIDAALPFLKISQKVSNRVIEEEKQRGKSNSETGAAEDAAGSKSPQTDLQKVISEAVKVAIEPISKELATLKAGKVTDSRRATLEEALKDSGSFATRTLKDFSRMRFDSEDEFDTYIEEVKADVAAVKQEQADNGLLKSPKPQGGDSIKKTEIDPVIQARIVEREAVTVAPAISGLPPKQ